MTERDDAELNELRAKLSQSREEFRALMDPPRESAGAPIQANGQSGFPRSRTMQMLMSSRGLGALGVLASGFLIARPGMALKLLRFLPTGAVAKVIIARAMSALNDRKQSKPK